MRCSTPSPFEQLSDEITQRFNRMSKTRRLAFLYSVAVVMRESMEVYTDERQLLNACDDRIIVVRETISEGFSATRDPGVVSSDPPVSLENAGPMLSMWICIDSAYRLACTGHLDIEIGWYVIEPTLVQLTENYFGCSDVGSEYEEIGERYVLDSESGAKFTSSVNDALNLSSEWNSEEGLDDIVEIIRHGGSGIG